MTFRLLLSFVAALQLSVFSPALLAAPSNRVEATNHYALTYLVDHYSKTRDLKSFIKSFGDHLKTKDRKYLLELSKGQRWPLLKRQGDVLNFGDQIRVSFVNAERHKVKINNVEFTLDPGMPLKMQTELVLNKIKSHQKNALFSLLIPEAEAFAPLIWIAGIVIAGVVSATTTTAITMYYKDDTGPIKAVVCMLGQADNCQKDDGSAVSADIIDTPGSDIDIMIRIEKCPDTSDKVFKMSTQNAEGHVVHYTTETVEAEGKVQLKNLIEQHGTRSQPNGYAPLTYTFDSQGSLSNVTSETPIITGNGQTYMTKLTLDSHFADEGSADNTAQNREKWESFKQVKEFVARTMALFCQKETKDTVSDPNKTQPIPIIVPAGGSQVIPEH
jgi:hypothetical protein